MYLLRWHFVTNKAKIELKTVYDSEYEIVVSPVKIT